MGGIIDNTEPKIYPEISTLKTGDKNLILISVKPSPQKPHTANGRPFKRVGKNTKAMSQGEYESLLLEKNKDKMQFDAFECKGAKLVDIDQVKVKWFLRKAKAERNFDIEPETPVKEALVRLGLIKNGKITNAAILLFGKNPQKIFLQAETRCARFKGIEPLEFIDMKVFGRNILDQRDDVVEFIKEHIKLHAKIVEMERAEKWEYPIEAIREAVTNALCHRDYQISSNVQVRIFDDRIEVWGCGPLPKPLTIDDLKKKHDSVLRNPLIGRNFFLIKFIEQWGTGTNRIIEECLKHGLPEPLFEEITENLVITFRKYKISEEEMQKLNERQKKAMEYLKIHKKITRSEYVKLTNSAERTAFRDIEELYKSKIITRKGTGKQTYYELA